MFNRHKIIPQNIWGMNLCQKSRFPNFSKIGVGISEVAFLKIKKAQLSRGSLFFPKEPEESGLGKGGRGGGGRDPIFVDD